MMRMFYQWVLRLHPERFRRRFEDEMMSIYDETSAVKGGLWLIADVIRSMFRQWVFRSEHWRRESGQSVVPVSGAMPRFVCLDSGVSASALAAGGVLTISFIAGMSFLATLGPRPVQDDSRVNFPRARWMAPGTGELGLLSASGVRSASPAERRMFEWLRAYNAGDLRRTSAFHQLHAQYVPYDPFAAEREVRVWGETFLDTGTLKLDSMIEYSPYSLVASCSDSHGTFWKIRLRVAPGYPNQVVLLQMGDHVLLEARTD